MPSSYTANTGIEKPGDGELSGTWGQHVNTNMDIIDRVLNGVGAISISGTSYTLTTSDGLLTEGMYRILLVTGSPTGTNTITIVPNDAQKIYYVKNVTAQTVIFAQGSGSNVSIFPGDSKIVYADGLGATGGVTDFSADLAMSSPSITGGTITGITDLAVADGGTGASDAVNARLNLGLGSMATQNGSNVTITGGNVTGITDITMADGGTGASLTAVNGGMLYSTASALALMPVGIAGQYPKSSGAGAPVWTTISLADLPVAWIKQACRLGSTANLSLTGAATVDGSVVVTGDRIFVKDQATASQNGPYVANTAGAWSRTADAPTGGAAALYGATVGVMEGAVNGGTQWATTFKSPSIIGTTTMSWFQVFNTSTVVPILNGGTGASTAIVARTNLGLGTMAVQDAATVAITGGSITGIVDLAIADGGTGASTAPVARTNLGLGTIATQDSTAVAITGGTITGITDLAILDGGTGASTAPSARANLGLGTLATQDAVSVAITGGTITGIIDLAIADGGTGASTAVSARGNLGLGTIATQNSSAVAITGGTITGIAGTFPDGTTALPGMAFSSDANTGFYRPASNIIGLVTGGIEQMRVIGSGSMLMGSASYINGIGAAKISTQSTQLIVATWANALFSGTSNGPTITLAKSRGATVDTYDITANGDVLGSLEFQGSDGVNMILGARIRSAITNIPALNDVRASLVFQTGSAVSAGVVSTRMTIDGSTISCSLPVTTTSFFTGGFATLASGATAMTLGTVSTNAVTMTNGTNVTYTTTVPTAGTVSTLIITTSGGASWSITFGTGFISQGPLATGVVSGKKFAISFISDGTNCIEVGARGTAM